MSGCCTPDDHDPTPEEERTGRLALVLIVAIGAATLVVVGILLLP
ncbi:hypothetical protein [Nocardiopsis potens]|nr:hypothetical protein [Nocardiopsis potens]